MRNRALTRKIINLLALRFQGIANLADDRIDWLTDVTNPKPGECMSQLGWDFAGALDPNFFNALDGEISWEDLKESILDLPDVAEFFYTLIMLGYNCPRW